MQPVPAYEDLLTLTTLTDDTGTITAHTTGCIHAERTPKHSVVLDTGSLGRGFQYDEDPQRAISIAGQWGYGDDYQDTGLNSLSANVTTTTATKITASSAGL